LQQSIYKYTGTFTRLTHGKLQNFGDIPGTCPIVVHGFSCTCWV